MFRQLRGLPNAQVQARWAHARLARPSWARRLVAQGACQCVRFLAGRNQIMFREPIAI